MSDVKYYKTVVVVEILSEHSALENIESLSDIHEAITTGDCVGKFDVTGVTELSAKDVAGELAKFGSEPGFFGLDEDGKSLDDSDDDDAPLDD